MTDHKFADHCISRYGVHMSHTIAQLHALTDDEVTAFHDQAAVHTGVGTDYWMMELRRRSSERAVAASDRSATATNALAVSTDGLARRTWWLTSVTGVLAGAALIAAIIHP